MEDLIEILLADDGVVVQNGAEIQYDKIEPPPRGGSNGVSQQYLEPNAQRLAELHVVVGAPGHHQRKAQSRGLSDPISDSVLEKFQPIASDILPGCIWNIDGTVFITAIGWLEECKLIRALEVRESSDGRRGMVILSADPQKHIPGTFKGMSDDELEDRLGEVDVRRKGVFAWETTKKWKPCWRKLHLQFSQQR